MQYLFYLFRSLLQTLRNLKAFLLEIAYQIIPGVALGFGQANVEIYAPPIPQSFVELCPAIIRTQCENTATNGDIPTMAFFLTMVVGVAAVVTATNTFGEKREKANYYRETSSGSNTASYFLARCTFDLFGIFKLTWMFLMMYSLILDPPGTRANWFITIYALNFAGFGMGYFFSNILVFDQAVVTGVVVAIAVSVSSGLSPSLSEVDKYPPLPFFWWISYSRWISEAIFLTMVNNWPWLQDRIDLSVSAEGYQPGNFSMDIGMTFLIGILWRIAAYIALRLRHRQLQK